MTVYACVTSGTMKVHLLQYLPDMFEKWGTLWAYSCFWFESLNGLLKKFVHGTRYVSSQVIWFIMGMDEHSKSASASAIMRFIPDMSPEQDQL